MALGYKSTAVSELKSGDVIDHWGRFYMVISCEESPSTESKGSWNLRVHDGEETTLVLFDKDFYLSQVVHV